MTAEEAEQWIEEMKAKALEVKSEMDKTKDARETELHKKLSQNKIQQLLAVVRI